QPLANRARPEQRAKGGVPSTHRHVGRRLRQQRRAHAESTAGTDRWRCDPPYTRARDRASWAGRETERLAELQLIFARGAAGNGYAAADGAPLPCRGVATPWAELQPGAAGGGLRRRQ